MSAHESEVESAVEIIVGAILDDTTHNGLDCGNAPTSLVSTAEAIVAALGAAGLLVTDVTL